MIPLNLKYSSQTRRHPGRHGHGPGPTRSCAFVSRLGSARHGAVTVAAVLLLLRVMVAANETPTPTRGPSRIVALPVAVSAAHQAVPALVTPPVSDFSTTTAHADSESDSDGHSRWLRGKLTVTRKSPGPGRHRDSDGHHDASNGASLPLAVRQSNPSPSLSTTATSTVTVTRTRTSTPTPTRTRSLSSTGTPTRSPSLSAPPTASGSLPMADSESYYYSESLLSRSLTPLPTWPAVTRIIKPLYQLTAAVVEITNAATSTTGGSSVSTDKNVTATFTVLKRRPGFSDPFGTGGIFLAAQWNITGCVADLNRVVYTTGLRSGAHGVTSISLRLTKPPANCTLYTGQLKVIVTGASSSSLQVDVTASFPYVKPLAIFDVPLASRWSLK